VSQLLSVQNAEEPVKQGLLDRTIVVISGDNGMPFPRCKATLYDMGTHVPLAIRWGKEIATRGRTVTDFVTLCDIAPTLLEAAHIVPPPVMTGRSLLPILHSNQAGRVDASRDHVLTGIERHVFQTPCRAIRTDDFLYIRNFGPENWPTGRGEGPPPTYDFTKKHWPSGAEAFSYNSDPSPTKQYMQQNADNQAVAPYCKLAFGPRPAEELYDLKNDPDQMNNVAGEPQYESKRKRLRERLDTGLQKSGDPRIVAETSSRPNVLFISLDDLNDWTGCLGGHPQAKTPNIDRLAESGVLFTQAYCAGASCNPSRTALMTGLPPYRSGLYDNRQKMREILPHAETLPAYFARNGYWSCGSGKILHYFIDARSWDEYYPKKETENPFPPTYLKNREGRPFNLPHVPWMYCETDWCAFDVTDDEFKGDALVADWVNRKIRQPPKQPMFLACGIYRPHEPWFVPKKYFDMFPLEKVQLPPGVKQDDLDDLPPLGKRIGPNRYLAHIRKHGKWREGVQAYLASIAYADAMLGRVIDTLDASPLAKNTIVVAWSDHGWHLGEKQHWQKFTPWRVCDRVPLIIRVPKGSPGLPEGTTAGGQCTRPVNLVDLFKTLNELSGLPEKRGLGGNSLVPLLKNPEAAWPHPSITHVGRPQRYAISTQRWRYIHYEDGGEELYDIETDPYEWTNLAAKPEYEAKLIELRKLAPTNMKPLERVHY